MRMSHNSGSCVINDRMFLTIKLNRGHSCSYSVLLPVSLQGLAFNCFRKMKSDQSFSITCHCFIKIHKISRKCNKFQVDGNIQ
jgi:hypothetical protein